MILQTKSLVEEHFSSVKVIYGDTDSVMVLFCGSDSVADAWSLGEKIAATVTRHFTPPNELELEKIYSVYLLIEKKKYVGMASRHQYDDSPKMDAKGTATVRRDSCRMVSETLQACLNALLVDRDPNKAEQIIIQKICDIQQNRVDLGDLVCSQGMNKEEYKSKPAIVYLAERMAKRKNTETPRVGDRLSWIVIDYPGKKPLRDCIEDPLYVLKHGIRPCQRYYIEKQLHNPAEQMLVPAIGAARFRLLFHGDHTRQRTIEAPKDIGIMRYLKRAPRCRGCSGPSDRTLCASCRPNETQILLRYKSQAKKLEKEVDDIWKTCLDCVQETIGDVHACSNMDCRLFFRRTRLSDLQEKAQKKLLDW